MANMITSSRIVLSIFIIFSTPFSLVFYFLYLLCGFTDMVDGYIARKRGTESDFGSKLDSIADMVFVAVCLFKMLPVITLGFWVWLWIVIVAFIKVVNIICGYFYHRQFIMLHTIANKITGVLLFTFPLFREFIDLKYVAIPLCALATFAAIQEGHYIRTDKNPSIK